MDVAVIDWKNVDSRFVRDEVFENINAPQWVDFSAPEAVIDDDSWFCRADCNHPKKVEDVYKEETTRSSKRSATVSDRLPFGERNRRDAALKKRGIMQPPIISPVKDLKYGRVVEDSENQNPNYSTPPNHKAKFVKEVMKSSTEKKQLDENTLRKEPQRSLRSTLSAKNLFAGGDIINKVTDFCNELKKLATRAKDRENVEEDVIKDSLSDDSADLDDKEKEKKPLLELSKEKNGTPLKSNKLQEKQRRKKRCDDSENTPITVDVKNIRREENLLQIRTCPPTPQCFSASHGTSKATPTPLQTFKPRTLERGILQELAQKNVDEKKCESGNKNNHRVHASSIDAEKEAKPLDVFWFLKPCTLSSLEDNNEKTLEEEERHA